MSKLFERKIAFPFYFHLNSWINEFKKRELLSRYRNQLEMHQTVYIGKYFEIEFLSTTSKLIVDEGVYFRKFCNVLLHKEGLLKINKNVFFNNYCSISCLGKIEIGENTLFGEGVKMYDHNHKYENVSGTLNIEKDQFTIGSIKIGKNCWVGSNVAILNNVEIGDNVIVGANCLIYKSIPANSVVKHTENLIVT